MKALLAAVAVIGLAAVAGAVIVGVRVFDGTVVSDPYARGIAWDADRERLASSGLRVDVVEKSFHTGENLLSLHVLQKEEPFTEQSVTVEAARPSSTAHDRTYTALRGMDGVFRTMIDLPLQGRWDLVVVIDTEEGPLRSRQGIYAAKKTPTPRSSSCDLDLGPCAGILQQSQTDLVFDVAPKPLKSMAPLDFTVVLAAKDAANGEIPVVLTMPGMFMGENVVRLRPEGDGRWKGQGVIVRCPSGSKTWKAEVSVPGLGSAAFVFEVDR